jgi:hypothetical protein
LNSGVLLKTAQRWSGHRTASVLLDTYLGVMRDDAVVSLARVEAALEAALGDQTLRGLIAALTETKDRRRATMATSGNTQRYTSAQSNGRSRRMARPVGVGPALHNANHTALVEGPVIALTPLHARVRVERSTVRDEVLDAVTRIQQRTGMDTFLRHEVVAEVLSSGTQFRRHSIYRALRRMSGREPGAAYVELEDVGNGLLRLRAHHPGVVAVGDLLSICWPNAR